ncbi:hypothetical protein [uncultured Tateyamaria sp.]|uniref:hypothetical protein n=1 Tax=uncultured Tateyamaria sp. TaxID=455651 RepID=UPI002609796E|nr:hypothetical protein [uncultured Tateyamaria sp.]
MVRRLVVHAGFHKTATTTLQNTLAAHSELLAPHAHILLRAEMKGLCEAARHYSKTGTEFDLGLVAYEAALLAEDWTQDTVLLSSEDLSGHMPGRHGLMDYSAAPRLVASMTDAWRAACPKARITWVYTTRAPGPWLASCHVQHLRAVRMTLDAAGYATAYAGSADLDGIVAQLRRTGADVTALPIEEHGDTLVDQLLRCADIPAPVRAQVRQVKAANTSPDPDRITALLDLNRSNLSHADWRAARTALLNRGH